MVRVLVADDSRAFVGATVSVVEAVPEFELVGVVHSGEDALAGAADENPDLVLMDIRMPGIGGVDAARRIREQHPGTLVVLLTADSSVAEGLDPHAFPVVDKRVLSAATLAELWERHSRR